MSAPRTDVSQLCEYVTEFRPDLPWQFCGKPTAYFYPAMGGGTMALCEEHAKPHLASATAIGMEALR